MLYQLTYAEEVLPLQTSRGGKKILHLTESILTFMISSIFTLIMKNIFVLNLIGA